MEPVKTPGPPPAALFREPPPASYVPPVRKQRVIKPTVASSGSNYQQRLNVDWLNGVYARTVAESVYNPHNTFFEIDRAGFRSDLNMDYRWIYNSKHRVVLRPRLYSQYVDIEYSDGVQPYTIQRNRGKIELTEAFGEAWISDQVSLTLGLQNYQWGPAELISPSNPIFHFSREQRSVLWKEKGHNLVRMNWSPTETFSFVALAEVANNQEAIFIADREFRQKSIFKTEFRSQKEAQNYLGLAAGQEEESKSFGGAYFNWMMLESLSIYGDSRFTHQGFTYAPKDTRGGLTVDMLEDERYSPNAMHHLGVFGTRYEGTYVDLRLEYVNNSRGFDLVEMEKAVLSASPLNPNFEQNIRRLIRPGLEFYGKHYGYFSLRIPDVGSNNQWQFYLRYLHSGMDGSGMISPSFERSMGDNFILYGEGRHSTGSRDREFTLQEKAFFFLGVKFLL